MPLEGDDDDVDVGGGDNGDYDVVGDDSDDNGGGGCGGYDEYGDDSDDGGGGGGCSGCSSTKGGFKVFQSQTHFCNQK